MLERGSKITVYDGEQVELGEGTLLQKVEHPEMNLVVYECKEHLILARGEHWLKIAGKMTRIPRLKNI
jgi:hypothetical protein